MSANLWVQIRDAIARALPVDPDDGTTVVRFGDADNGAGGSPVWGAPEVLANKIADAVMEVLDRGKAAPDNEGREASIYLLTLGNLIEGYDRDTLSVAIAAAVEHGLNWKPETRERGPL